MATDATLVQASFKEAAANVKQFDPNVAKLQAGLVGQVLDPITEMLAAKDLENKEKNKADNDLKDAQIAEFTEIADALNLKLSTYERGGREEGMHEQIYNNTFDYAEELKKEYEKYNTVGDEDTAENRKKRTEILGKLNSAKNAAVQLRTDVLAISKIAGSEDGGNQMSEVGMTTAEIAITKEILNMDGDYSNVTQRWENNGIVFDVTIPDEVFSKLSPEEQKLGQTRTWKAPDIKKNFKTIPKEMMGDLIAQRTDVQKSAKKAKWDDKFGLQADADKTIKLIGKDKDAAGHIFQTRQEGDPSQGWDAPGGPTGKWKPGSWGNALESHLALNGTYKVQTVKGEKEFDYNLSIDTKKEIVDDLIDADNGVDMSDVDTDGGGISNAEYEAFMTGSNRDLAIDVLVNPKNPLYDHDLSVSEYANFRAKQNGAIFKANQPAGPKEDRSGKSTYVNRNIDFHFKRSTSKEGDRTTKETTTSDNLILLGNQLEKLKSSGVSSFDNESFVDLFGVQIGYFPATGKHKGGFAKVRLRKDGQIVRDTRYEKGEFGFMKTPMDVFRAYSIPLQYVGMKPGEAVKSRI